MKQALLLAVLALAVTAAGAKLPAPGDEAKAKAAEAAAKAAHGNKVADYQLCQSMDKIAARYLAESKKAGKELKPATATPPCTDPGAFVAAPPAPASGAAPAAAATAAATAASATGLAATAAAPKKP